MPKFIVHLQRRHRPDHVRLEIDADDEAHAEDLALTRARRGEVEWEDCGPQGQAEVYMTIPEKEKEDIDTSDIPEADEEFFKRAKLRRPNQ